MSGESITATVLVDKSVYDLDCVQRAAASLTNLASFNFQHHDSGISITISVRSPTTLTSKDLSDRFLNELLDQSLRQRIATETKTERDLVLAYAFSNTKIVG
jgi:His-Xaa-Ser system protein HxsD